MFELTVPDLYCNLDTYCLILDAGPWNGFVVVNSKRGVTIVTIRN